MNFKFRKAILLIHGFAGGNYDYGDLGNDLELFRSFDVFTFTLPGHDKVVINRVTREDWIKKAETQIEKLINNGYHEIYIIGHSMGGVIASYLASKYKEVKKLVLAAPAFRYFSFKNDKLDVVQSLKKVPKLFKEYPSEEILSRFFKVPITTIKEFMKLVEEHTNDIQKITCPTLILWGTKDEIVPKDSVNYVFDNISSKSVTLFEIKTLTHDLFINDRYEDVKKIITFFLRKNPKRKKEKFKI
mgnify:CR=1 FL=1